MVSSLPHGSDEPFRGTGGGAFFHEKKYILRSIFLTVPIHNLGFIQHAAGLPHAELLMTYPRPVLMQ